jgi:hypothetical protein
MIYTHQKVQEILISTKNIKGKVQYFQNIYSNHVNREMTSQMKNLRTFHLSREKIAGVLL